MGKVYGEEGADTREGERERCEREWRSLVRGGEDNERNWGKSERGEHTGVRGERGEGRCVRGMREKPSERRARSNRGGESVWRGARGEIKRGVRGGGREECEGARERSEGRAHIFARTYPTIFLLESSAT